MIVADFRLTKPIHETQIMLCGEKSATMKEKHPNLSEGAFFSIDCIENYELIRELSSFGKDLIVLQPREIQDKVYERISSMMEYYSRVRT